VKSSVQTGVGGWRVECSQNRCCVSGQAGQFTIERVAFPARRIPEVQSGVPTTSRKPHRTPDLPLSKTHRSDRSASPWRGGGRSPRRLQRLPITSRSFNSHHSPYRLSSRAVPHPAGRNFGTPINERAAPRPLTLPTRQLQSIFANGGIGVRRSSLTNHRAWPPPAPPRLSPDRSHRRGGQTPRSRSHLHQAS